MNVLTPFDDFAYQTILPFPVHCYTEQSEQSTIVPPDVIGLINQVNCTGVQLEWELTGGYIATERLVVDVKRAI
jgi:hypothetical protein